MRTGVFIQNTEDGAKKANPNVDVFMPSGPQRFLLIADFARV
jgi:hypothetical protein